MRALDLSGFQYGKLTVIERSGHAGKKVLWRCKCQCGGETHLPTGVIRANSTKSCGCLMAGRMKPAGWVARRDLVGQRFGRLAVVSALQQSGKRLLWQCVCDCGSRVNVRTGNLRSGTTSSCGCLQKDRTVQRHRKHGAKSLDAGDLSTTWLGMKQRCYNSNSENYHLYGARGITICDRWLKGEDGLSGFECFVADMGPKPTPKHTIDRWPDNDGPYAPDNCRWATMSEQNHNKRSNGVKAPIQTQERMLL